jgi:hypothetical protein
MATSGSGVFRFPDITRSAHDAQVFSFRRADLELLGQYFPGAAATIFNPLQTGAEIPEAIARHEATHQFLGINTTFGLFTQLLMHRARRGLNLEVLKECMKRQWCVQELAATYEEMSLIACKDPELLNQNVRRLPSLRLNQPPYREVFEVMHHYLPVATQKPLVVLVAQAMIVRLLAFAAMNSDCLLRMRSEGDDTSLLVCMEDAPNSRMERIIDHLVRKDLLTNLVDYAATALSRVINPEMEKKTSSSVFRQIVELVPEVAIQAADAVEAQLMAATNGQAAIQRFETDPLPEIRDSDERYIQEMAAHPPRRLSLVELRQRFTRATEDKLGLSLELAIRKDSPDEVLVTPRFYFLKPGQAPLPTNCHEEEPDGPLPEPTQGLIVPSDVLRELESFPNLPHVVVFISDSWRRWHDIPGARQRFSASVQVCREHSLSYPRVSDILAFEGLGEVEATQFFVSRASAGQFIGHFFNPHRPLIHGLQRIPSRFGLNLFGKMCDQLKVPQCTDPKSATPYLNLLMMVSFPYQW